MGFASSAERIAHSCEVWANCVAPSAEIGRNGASSPGCAPTGSQAPAPKSNPVAIKLNLCRLAMVIPALD
jgi:hypothetical protein